MITRANVSEECWSEHFIALRLKPIPNPDSGTIEYSEDTFPMEYRCWEYNRAESQDADTIHGIKHVTQADILVLNINDELMAYTGQEFNEKFASEDIEGLLNEKQKESKDGTKEAEDREEEDSAPEIVAASIKPKEKE